MGFCDPFFFQEEKKFVFVIFIKNQRVSIAPSYKSYKWVTSHREYSSYDNKSHLVAARGKGKTIE